MECCRAQQAAAYSHDRASEYHEGYGKENETCGDLQGSANHFCASRPECGSPTWAASWNLEVFASQTENEAESTDHVA